MSDRPEADDLKTNPSPRRWGVLEGDVGAWLVWLLVLANVSAILTAFELMSADIAIVVILLVIANMLYAIYDH